MLPFMRTRPKKVERRTVAFGGLNKTPTINEGELSEARNLTMGNYPHLSTRTGRTKLTEYSNPSALHSFNGFIVVNGTDLIYNNQIVGGVSVGPKQFAVVNKKLVIHPDMLLLDLENNKLSSLAGEVTSAVNAATFGKDGDFDYLQVTASITGGTETRQFSYTDTTIPTVKKYSSLSWSSGGGWVKSGEAEVLVTALVNGDKIIPTKVLETGAYVIPTKTINGYTGEENNEGIYFTISSASSTNTYQYKWEKFNVVSYDQPYSYYTDGNWYSLGSEELDPGYTISGFSSFSGPNASTGNYTGSGSATGGVNKPGTVYGVSGNQVTEHSFYPGPAGTKNTGWWQQVRRKNSILQSGSDTYYSKGSTSYGYVYGAAGAYPDNYYSGSYWYVKIGTTGYTGVTNLQYTRINSLDFEPYSMHFKAGDIVNISGCTSIAANNKNDLTVKSVTDLRITFEDGSALTAGSEAGAVKVERPVPDLDFICANDNRLWGVNSEGIYASAWADPTNFRKLSGVSTDSYFAEIGTAGEFTGIFSYSGDVLCFKENRLYRVFGEYPAEFSVQSYDVAGLQDGCHKSLAIINEILYYKGKEGVYAYSGGIPTLVSYPLGVSNHSNARAGVDGLHYYISMQDHDDLWCLFVYDTLTKMWLQEDNTKAVDFTYQDGFLYVLNENDGAVYKLNDPGSTEEVQWEATFATFYGETIARKTHNRVFMRVDMEAGSFLEVFVKFDDGNFSKVFSTWFDGRKTMVIPVPIMRCDSFTIKLSGSGPCRVMALEREYIQGSDY